jgi:hypothetical protein
MSLIPRLLSHVSYLVYLVLCLLFHVSCPMSLVPCLFSHASYPMSPVPCLLSLTARCHLSGPKKVSSRVSTEVSKYRKSQIEKYFIKEVHLYGKYLTEVLNHHTREFV